MKSIAVLLCLYFSPVVYASSKNIVSYDDLVQKENDYYSEFSEAFTTEKDLTSIDWPIPKFINKNNSLVSNNTRESKFFGFGYGIGLVRFENSYCVGRDGLDGTCYTRRQCRTINGTSSGLCAGSIGYCCILIYTCGGISAYNNTYFSNLNYPGQNAAGAVCTFVIKRCNVDICQVRIDFLNLILAGPNATGYCVYDSMQVTGGSSLIRPICGINSGQHIYVGFNNNDDITITITTSQAITLGRSWFIKISQIACTCPTFAPTGCLMYYTGLSGTVNSFNFGVTQSNQLYEYIPPGTNTPILLPGTRELANLNYGVCIRMEAGYCSIQWTANTFAVSGSTPSQATPIDGCLYDYVIIPNPIPTQNINSFDRFCGNTFPITVTSSSKPFVLYVVTDASEYHGLDINQNEIGNLGFSLNFRQLPCQAPIF